MIIARDIAISKRRAAGKTIFQKRMILALQSGFLVLLQDLLRTLRADVVRGAIEPPLLIKLASAAIEPLKSRKPTYVLPSQYDRRALGTMSVLASHLPINGMMAHAHSITLFHPVTDVRQDTFLFHAEQPTEGPIVVLGPQYPSAAARTTYLEDTAIIPIRDQSHRFHPLPEGRYFELPYRLPDNNITSCTM